MIRRLLLTTVALALAIPGWAAGQRAFARAFDLSTPTVAATTNYIVTSVNLTNTSFTLAHQPDVPRNITIAVTDTTPSITAGTVTCAGTDVNDAAQSEALDLSVALTLTGAKLFKTIGSCVSAGAVTLGGAGDETIIIGVGSVVSYIYCVTSDPLQGGHNLITSGSSTTVTTVGSLAAFGGIVAGDEIYAKVAGVLVRRVVSTVTSPTSLTLTSAANWQNGTTGYPFQWRHRACGYSDVDGWVSTDDAAATSVKVDLGDGSGTALTATGGLDVSIECVLAGDDAAIPAQLLTTNMTSVLKPASSQVIPVLERCSAVRVGLKWGTVDTAGTDSVSASILTVVRQ